MYNRPILREKDSEKYILDSKNHRLTILKYLYCHIHCSTYRIIEWLKS